MTEYLILKEKFNFAHLLNAYICTRKRKRWKDSCIEFSCELEEELRVLRNEVNNRIWKPKSSTAFVVEEPKVREIWAANFRDRIVHWLIYNEIGEYYEKQFIYNSCSCIKGKGVMFGVDRLEKMIRRETCGYSKEAYYLQIDIKNFFVSINKSILWSIFMRKIRKDSLIGWLLYRVIFDDVTNDCKIVNKKNLGKVPKYKSLFHCKILCGLPIGNLTSQFFSNVYMNELDQFVKHVLKAKSYVRYVDDAVIVSRDKDYLLWVLGEIRVFLWEKLGLELCEDKVKLLNCKSGIDFLGTILLKKKRRVRKRVLRSAESVCFEKDLDRKVVRMNSYLGIMRRMDTYKERRKLCIDSLVMGEVGYNEEYTKLVRVKD